MTDESAEIDPFVKRVVTVRPGDVVIFRFQGRFESAEQRDDIKAQLQPKMGTIPFVVIDDHFDLTVLKSTNNGQPAFIA